MFSNKMKISILGFGNIGSAIGYGLVNAKMLKPEDLTVTRKGKKFIDELNKEGFNALNDNKEAVRKNRIIILAVTPHQLNRLLNEIKDVVTEEHIIISVVSGACIKQIKSKLNVSVSVIRVMPNTAIAISESMTCIAAEDADNEAIELTKKIFNAVGQTIEISEDLMGSATALCACGLAFFLRAVRAASQGGIEIGFHSEEALFMAAQTAKGAAAMLIKGGKHPESEIDKVTTPQGITISGLNEMEHNGFSSSMIKGIVIAAKKANKIYSNNGEKLSNE
ncbi:MAG TPA: pyrroline-5-carboxylate reductase [Ignavibacteria bacterium]|nr:pyrroline-5-carboxylate reductase [Ignavibacteria bacterium]